MRCGRLFLIVSLLAGPASAQDAFEQQRAATLARMRGVDPIYLTFAEGRSTYQMGEPIRLGMEFSPAGLKSAMAAGCAWGSALVAVVDRADGALDPRLEPWRDPRDTSISGAGCGDEYVSDGLPLAGASLAGLGAAFDRHFMPLLVREELDLTWLVRFTAPGRYRVYLRTRFETPTDRTPPRLSGILTIEILPTDPSWEAMLLAQASHALGSNDFRTHFGALANLSRLGTNAAVDLVARLEDASLEQMPWAARDRAYVVRRMTERLDDLSRPVDWRFLWTLAAADATTRGPTPVTPAHVEARLQEHSARRLRALAAHGRLDSALGVAMFRAGTRPDTANRVIWDVPAAGFAAVPDAVAKALLALPPLEQRVILDTQLGWREFVDPVFLPMFRKIAHDRRPGGAQDVAWAMWHRLEPRAARDFAVREIGVPGAALGTSGLPALGPGLLPSLDDALAARLETAATDDERLRVATLIERFSTGRSRARIARVFEREPRAALCPQGPVLLAYFFRVDPAYAETQLDHAGGALDASQGRCAGDGLLPAVLRRRTLPAAERAAIRRLADPRPLVVVDAAEALAIGGGSGTSKSAIMAALDAWHAAWAPRAAELNGFERSLELQWAAEAGSRLADALTEGRAWRLPQNEINHIASRLFNDRERRRFLSNHRAMEDAQIVVFPPERPGSAPTMFLPGWVSTSDEGTLRDRLALWPAGTSWRITTRSGFGTTHVPGLHPTSLWLPGEEQALLGRIRTVVESLGMTVLP